MYNQKVLASILIGVVVVAMGFAIYKSRSITENIPSSTAMVTNFEDCANAGYPVMESYPRQCRVPGGELFVENISNSLPNPSPTPKPVTGKCFIGGCSGQICSDQEGMISNCEYRPEYACYKNAKCERQTNGACGWTQTSTLSACLNNGGNKIAAGYVTGHVTIGPNCPVERVDEPCPTPPEAYTSREALAYASDGITIKDRVHLDTSGNYKLALAPGNYLIQIKPAGIGAGEKKTVAIKAFETSVVNFDIDTGIR